MTNPQLMPSPADGSYWPEKQSLYVVMRDGVRLAVDVYLPAGLTAGQRVPAVLLFTRYWRPSCWAAQVPSNVAFSEQRAFLESGYARVDIDVRGTGASFGSRKAEWSFDELRDQQEIIAWVAAQHWCVGRVGTVGTSYSGNTAELAQIGAHPALRAVAPRFADFDWYEFIMFPGGLRNIAFGPDWGQFIAALDANVTIGPLAIPGGPSTSGVLPVDGDADGALLAQAVREHANNHKFALVGQLECRDDETTPGVSPAKDSANLAEQLPALKAGARPAQHWLSWLDSGTAAGGLARWRDLDGPLELIIGTWNHGGAMDGDPFFETEATQVDLKAHFDTLSSFFDKHLKAETAGKGQRRIRYKTMNVRDPATAWRESDVWPPAGTKRQTWYAGPGGRLTPHAPTAVDASDTYQVAFEHRTGQQTRWSTSMGGPVRYPNRAEEDRRLLCWTSAPLESDLCVTGEALLTLYVSCTTEDAAFIAYLEHVAPDGHVRYVTEGGLRAIHRATPKRPVPYSQAGPPRSFRREDLQPLIPHEPTEIVFALLPTSVVFRAGDCIRLALAGADADSFARIPAHGASEWIVHRSATRATRIELPAQSSLG